MPSFARPRSTTPRPFVWSVWSCVMRTASRFAGSDPGLVRNARRNRACRCRNPRASPLPVAVSSTTAALPRLPLASTCNASRWFIGSRISSRCLQSASDCTRCAPLAPRIPNAQKGVPEWHRFLPGFSFQNAPRAGGIAADRESTVPRAARFAYYGSSYEHAGRTKGTGYHGINCRSVSRAQGYRRSLSNATPSTRCRPWRAGSVRFASHRHHPQAPWAIFRAWRSSTKSARSPIKRGGAGLWPSPSDTRCTPRRSCCSRWPLWASAANDAGGAGGPLAVLVVAVVASELGKAVSKETKVDIIVTPAVTIPRGLRAWL